MKPELSKQFGNGIAVPVMITAGVAIALVCLSVAVNASRRQPMASYEPPRTPTRSSTFERAYLEALQRYQQEQAVEDAARRGAQQAIDDARLMESRYR